MASPRHRVDKVYEVVTADALDDLQIQAILAGVVLRDDPVPVRAIACEQTGTRQMRLTIAEGKYHQVKRMVAAVGNRVCALHRIIIGGFSLPANLEPGQWMWLEDGVVAMLNGRDGSR
jgi:16S rRNA pseudouridine516 synthase